MDKKTKQIIDEFLDDLIKKIEKKDYKEMMKNIMNKLDKDERKCIINHIRFAQLEILYKLKYKLK